MQPWPCGHPRPPLPEIQSWLWRAVRDGARAKQLCISGVRGFWTNCVSMGSGEAWASRTQRAKGALTHRRRVKFAPSWASAARVCWGCGLPRCGWNLCNGVGPAGQGVAGGGPWSVPLAIAGAAFFVYFSADAPTDAVNSRQTCPQTGRRRCKFSKDVDLRNKKKKKVFSLF